MEGGWREWEVRGVPMTSELLDLIMLPSLTPFPGAKLAHTHPQLSPWLHVMFKRIGTSFLSPAIKSSHKKRMEKQALRKSYLYRREGRVHLQAVLKYG